MRYCKNNQLNRFVEDFVSFLSGINAYRGRGFYNIPLMISTICQQFNDKEENYKMLANDFQDIESLNRFRFEIAYDINDDFLEEAVFMVYTPQYNRYLLTIGYDDRYIGYCMCDSSCDGYREDKHCCGEECDWTANYFELYKLSQIADCRWEGKERDYWKFEDRYYGRISENDETFSENNKVDKEKERLIEEMRKQIVELQNKLYQLQQ